jgi:16S rRNA (guanine527-N7)-methyltransferase
MALPAQTVSSQAWQDLLGPYLDQPPASPLLAALETYFQLLLRWNARINLTAIRTPDAIIQRHFGESLFLARHVPRGTSTLLDHGSGAGFPGLPIALARPDIAVTLAESHARKATFLREVVRALGLANVTVHGGRTESLPSARSFAAVTLRAVDNPDLALQAAAARVAPGGWLYWFAGPEDAAKSADLPGLQLQSDVPVPNSLGAVLRWQRV